MFNLRVYLSNSKGRTMGPLAVRQKPKLRQLNYFTDKAKLEAQGPRRPGREEDRVKKKGRRAEKE